jgi:hypothetical protein
MRRYILTIAIVGLTPMSASAQSTEPSNIAIARQIASEISQVKAAATPAEWLREHPDEKLQTFHGRQLVNDTTNWCTRTFVRHESTTSRTWTRYAYFYDPQPPPTGALPATGASSTDIVATTCKLGLIWVEMQERNPIIGMKLTEDIEAELASHYGPGSTPQLAGGFGSAGWIHTQQWRLDADAVLTVAHDQFRGESHRVLVRLAFPNSDAIHDAGKETEQLRADMKAERVELERRVKEVGMPSEPTTEMTALLEEPDYFGGRNLPSGSRVALTLRKWLEAAESRPAGQQVIALLAADRVLDFLDHDGVLMEAPARAQLKDLGISYVHDELAGSDVYTHGLLEKAKALAPPGPAADEVLLLQMERGFDETGMCSAGSEEFTQVIQRGESLLAGARALPISTLSSLHLMIGDAYATIVWLATTTDSEYHDAKKYQPEAESARAKALEHYRAALTLEHGTARAKRTWKQAWRLAARLPPTTERYYCVYD